MLLIIIILFVAYIIIPLLDLTLKEQALFFAKVLIYVLALVYIAYSLITAKTF